MIRLACSARGCVFLTAFLGVVTGCGSENKNQRLAVPEVTSQKAREMNEGVFGIVGGSTMTTASPLLRHMRALRHRFQMGGYSGSVKNGGDRLCSGVAVAKNIAVTAAHCVELPNNAGEYIFTGFHPSTTLPYIFGSRRLFFGNLGSSHHLPSFPESSASYTAVPNYGTTTASSWISHGTSIRSADVGFVFDWVNSSPDVIPLCKELPKVGIVVTVTGLKLTYRPTATPSGYYLNWGEYQAKVIQVTDRPTTILNLTSTKPAVWNYSSPTFSPSTVSTAMEFVSEALDPAKNCAEGGDSGGGVFLTRTDGTRCLLGVNSTRGSTVNLGTTVQCTPTTHRRIIPEMLASLPDTQQSGAAQSFTANSTDGARRYQEFNELMSKYPDGVLTPLP